MDGTIWLAASLSFFLFLFLVFASLRIRGVAAPSDTGKEEKRK